jgi:hypothetical protein
MAKDKTLWPSTPQEVAGLHKAAAADDPDALTTLAVLYEEGTARDRNNKLLVRRDRRRGRSYWDRAAQLGDPAAITVIADNLTPRGAHCESTRAGREALSAGLPARARDRSGELGSDVPEPGPLSRRSAMVSARRCRRVSNCASRARTRRAVWHRHSSRRARRVRQVGAARPPAPWLEQLAARRGDATHGRCADEWLARPARLRSSRGVASARGKAGSKRLLRSTLIAPSLLSRSSDETKEQLLAAQSDELVKTLHRTTPESSAAKAVRCG